MFGHQNDDNHSEPPSGDNTAEPSQAPEPPQDGAEQPAEQPAADTQHAPSDQPDTVTPEVDGTSQEPQPDAQESHSAESGSNQEAGQDFSWQHPGAPLNNDQEQISDVISPAGGFPKRPSYQYPSGGKPALDVPDDAGAEADPALRELIDVKEHALEELAPLLDKLDLPPEEKFRAIMMILQANDDKNLVKLAYETAHAIEDDETRARALYTIVNEVDYFTHPQDQDSPQAD